MTRQHTAFKAQQRSRILQVLDQLAGTAPTLQGLIDLTRLSPCVVKRHLAALEEAGMVVPGSTASYAARVELRRPEVAALSDAELTWCRANPARIRAMMAIAGGGR